MPAALVAALALACAAPAHAAVFAGGELHRGEEGGPALELTVNNGSDGGETFQAMRIEIPGAGEITDVSTVGSAGSCVPAAAGTVQCQFPAPYLRPGERLEVSLTTAQEIATGAGASVFPCVSPCNGDYVGPFQIAGPSSGPPTLDAAATVKAWRKKRMRAGDACTPAKALFGVALGALCSARTGAVLRGFVVNSSQTDLALTIFGPGGTKRFHVPGYGGAGFTRRAKLKRGAKLLLVDSVSGAKTSLPVRLPAKLKRP